MKTPFEDLCEKIVDAVRDCQQYGGVGESATWLDSEAAEKQVKYILEDWEQNKRDNNAV